MKNSDFPAFFGKIEIMNKTDINSTDFDEMKYLAQVYGPQRHPWDKLIPLMIGRCPIKRKYNGF